MVTIRPQMAIAALAMLLCASSSEGFAQCPSGDKTSNDRKLELLNRDLDRSNRDSVECAFALMDDLSREGDQRVLPVLIRNLDLKRTFDQPTFFPLTPYPDYPAIGDLTWFESKADPLLLDAIAQATPGSLLSQNATKTLIAIQRIDPSEGIRILLNRAAKEHGDGAANMIEAAKYAVSLCRSKKQPCEDALKSVQ